MPLIDDPELDRPSRLHGSSWRRSECRASRLDDDEAVSDGSNVELPFTGSVVADRAHKTELRAPGRPTDTAMTLWALTAPELYELLVRPGGMGAEAYERWVASTLRYVLLAD